jgi:hypothetical protein
MKARSIALAAAIAAIVASPALFAQKAPSGNQVGLDGNRGSGSVDGTPTLTVNVPIGGFNSRAACGATPNAANSQINVTLGANAVVTGVGAVGSVEAFSPSWLSEATLAFRGAVAAENIFLTVSASDAPGVATFDFPPIDITGAGFPNVTLGAAGVLNIEACEDFDDASVAIDATWRAPTFVRVACFNCFDPFAERISVPSTSTWSLIALLLALGLAGGVAVRRFS